MVATREVLEPDTDRRAALVARYVDFVSALTDRGWLDPRTAAHAAAPWPTGHWDHRRPARGARPARDQFVE